MSRCRWVLGYASQQLAPGRANWYDTFIGGHAVWPDNLSVTVPPCPKCRHARRLVSQAYAPHNAHSEREIYLFGCNSIVCSSDDKSWLALRVCKVDRKPDNDNRRVSEPSVSDSPEHQSAPTGGTEAINWDTDSEESEDSAGELADELSVLSLEVQLARAKAANGKCDTGNKPAAVPAKRLSRSGAKRQASNTYATGSNAPSLPALPNSLCFDSYYIEVEEEPTETQQVEGERSVTHLLSKYREEERSRSASGVAEVWDTEIDDEDTSAVRSFEKFRDTICRAPEQVLRYSFGAEPIWPKHPPPSAGPITNCQCGSSLAFEVQFLGSCLHYLRPDKSVEPSQAEAGMNFAAIAVYTCAADCTKAKMLAESQSFKVFSQTVRVQQDEW